MLSRFLSLGLAFSLLTLTLAAAPRVHAQDSDGVTVTPSTVRIALDFKETPIQEALQQVFRKAGVRYKINDKVTGTVTLTATDLPYEQAFLLILRSNTERLGYAQQNGLFTIYPQFGNYDPYAGSGQSFFFTPVITDGRKHVWASGPYAVQALLQDVCREARLPFVIGGGVQGNISLSLADVPVEKAIDMICRASSPAITHRVEAGIHVFETLPQSGGIDLVSQVCLWIINEEANMTALLTRFTDKSTEYREALARVKSLKEALAKLEGKTLEVP